MSTTTRVHNFSAGPCTLPISVLEEVHEELLNFNDLGMSLLEDSHRGTAYGTVHHEALSNFRLLAEVPEDYAVLFLPGGATLQFSQVPINLLAEGETASYVTTGYWAKRALIDARQISDLHEAWNGTELGFARTPNADELDIADESRYVHITTNETIGGTRFTSYPDINFPLVADMSSDFLSRPINWPIFDLVYGGVQKNLAPAGMSVVIVRRESLGRSDRNIPSSLDYRVQDENNSLANTPPMFSIWVMGKVLKWMIGLGGLKEFERRAIKRASLLYKIIEESNEWYRSPVDEDSRSQMNVIFHLPTEELETRFLVEAANANLVNLKGHRSVGGIRASIYNALPTSSVEALATFMTNFRVANS